MVDIPAWIDELCRPLVERLCSIDGVEALVLGGSQARGTAWPDSDVDIALGYYPDAPFSIEELDRAASELDDQHRTGLVTNFGEWGPGVNGGGWLVIDDNHVDFLYRDLARVREVILRCCEGKPEAWNQLGHPMGFQSQIYIGEVDCCVPLYDPAGEIAALKALIPQYPERLRRALVEKHLFDAEFESALAEKPARRGDIVYANGMMFRASEFMVLVLFALNRRYFVNEKMAFLESESFATVPDLFHRRVREIFADLGESPEQVADRATQVRILARDLRALCTSDMGPLRPSGFELR